MPDDVLTARARLANASRKGKPEADRIAAKRDLAAAKLARYIKQIVAEAPPLTDSQRTELTCLLQAGKAGAR